MIRLRLKCQTSRWSPGHRPSTILKERVPKPKDSRRAQISANLDLHHTNNVDPSYNLLKQYDILSLYFGIPADLAPEKNRPLKFDFVT